MSRTPGIEDTSDHTVNVFEEAEKIVKAHEKPIFRLEAQPVRQQIQSPGEVKGLSTIINREPSPTPGRFSRQSLDLFQVRVDNAHASQY